jgi:hypothetical protein
MLIGDTSRQHYSRERTHAGHKSYEGNNTGKQQQNMINLFIVKTGYMKVEARKYSLDSINFIAM